MKTFIIGLIIGYILHFSAIEIGNISSQIRWQNCILKMHSGEYPKSLPDGQHYCLGTVWSKEVMPLYEQAMLFSLDLYEELDKRFMESFNET